MTTLLTVLSFPNNRRICWSNLTEKKKKLLLHAAQSAKMMLASGQMFERHVTSWSSAISKYRGAKYPFSFAPPHFRQSVSRILSSWKLCMPTRYKCTVSVCICHLQRGLFTLLCNFRSFCQNNSGSNFQTLCSTCSICHLLWRLKILTLLYLCRSLHRKFVRV